MLTAAWGIPFNFGIPLSFEGFANYIGTKGKNEFGGDTAAETNIDMQIMYDLSAAVGAAKNTFKVGLEYQYWKNKFGNSVHQQPGRHRENADGARRIPFLKTKKSPLFGGLKSNSF